MRGIRNNDEPSRGVERGKRETLSQSDERDHRRRKRVWGKRRGRSLE
jgi:hypothetical protein